MLANQQQKQSKEAPDEQLLRLYWNRAAVKKELAELREERHSLLDRLKQQEGAVVRAQEQLEALERLLINPEAASNAMVFFQLRHLWRVARQRLQQFATELRLQLEKKERDHLHAEVRAKRLRRLKAIDEKAASLAAKRAQVSAELKGIEEGWDRTNVVIQLFKRRAMRKRRQGLYEGLSALRDKLEELEALKEKISQEALPEPVGLSIESRRLVNVAILAYAQELVLHFADRDLCSLSKAAMEKPVTDMKFGDRGDCDRMVEIIRRRIDDLRAQDNPATLIKRRADALLAVGQYRNESDSVPIAECLSSIKPHLGEEGKTRRASDAPIRINVLSEEYWDLYPMLV